MERSFRPSSYDPSKGVFEPVGSMGLGGARGEVGSQVRLADGRVLVIGSTGGQRDGRWPYTRFTLLYDPATRSFTPSTKVPDGIDLYGLVGEVLADGRVRWTGGPGVNRIVWYDPTTGSFAQTVTTAAEYPALEAAALDVSLDDGRHLIFGYRPVLHPYASIYDPVSRSWTDLEPPPFIGSLEATALPDGRVLILGDWSALFDPATGRFTPVDAGPDAFGRLDRGRSGAPGGLRRAAWERPAPHRVYGPSIRLRTRSQRYPGRFQSPAVPRGRTCPTGGSSGSAAWRAITRLELR